MTRSIFVACLATVALLTGCGQAAPPAAVSAPKSMKVSQAVVGGPSTYEAKGVPQPKKQTGMPTQGAAYEAPKAGTGAATTTPAGKLEAAITSEKNGSLLGMGTYKCSVEVTNPTGQRLTGTLTVTFMNGEKPSKTAPVVRPVDVPANGSISLDFEDKKWSTDGAEFEIETAAAPPGGLTAAVVSTKNGVVFGMGKFKATVEVKNPTAATKTGTVVVTFTDNGEPVKGSPIRQEVTLDAGETVTLDFEDKGWATDAVEVDVE